VKIDDVPPANDWVDENVAPGGRPEETVKVTILEPSVALTMNLMVEPAATVCGPGTKSSGGLRIFAVPCPALALWLASPRYVATMSGFVVLVF